MNRGATHRKSLALRLAACVAALSLAACASAPSTMMEKSALQKQSKDALNHAQAQDPTLVTLLGGAEAYAVFPDVTKVGVGVGGAYGKGVFIEHGVLSGYCELTQGSIGAQLGAQSYMEVIAFQTKEAVAQFKAGGFSLGAQVTAVALKSGAGATATYDDGVVVLTTNEQGLMAEASVGGQSFQYQTLTGG